MKQNKYQKIQHVAVDTFKNYIFTLLVSVVIMAVSAGGISAAEAFKLLSIESFLIDVIGRHSIKRYL